MKAQFKSQSVVTFQDQINAQYDKNWEEYKRQSSGNVQYTRAKKAASNKGFIVGALCAMPLLAMFVMMF